MDADAPRNDAGAGDAAAGEAGAEVWDASSRSDAEAGPGTAAEAGTDTGVVRADSGMEGDARAADAGSSAQNDGGTLRTKICGEGNSWPNPLPAADKRVAQRVGSERFGFVEGPVWLADQGVLLFSDMDFAGDASRGPAARIRRLTPPARFDVFAEGSNSNGLALLPSGTVLAATHDTQSLSLFDAATGMRTALDIRFGGKRLNSPNDIAVRSDGTVYFTDPDWQLGPRTPELGRDKTNAYRVPPPLSAGTTLAAEVVDATLQDPNGVALSPDEQTLYLGSSGNEVWQFSVAADGKATGRAKFAEVGGSDGMTVDCAGNLYVTSGTVEVFSRTGMKLGEITVAENPSNLAFGGSDRKTLYITAQTGLYSIALEVPGFPF